MGVSTSHDTPPTKTTWPGTTPPKSRSSTASPTSRSSIRGRSIVLLGLDSSGKSTLLYQLTLSRFVVTLPTPDSTSATLPFNGHLFRLFDVGGTPALRKTWPSYAAAADAIIFVVDASSSPSRLALAAAELESLRAGPGGKVPMLVLANMQDREGARSAGAVAAALEVPAGVGVLPCCARSGEGVRVGFEWLAGELARVKRQESGGDGGRKLLRFESEAVKGFLMKAKSNLGSRTASTNTLRTASTSTLRTASIGTVNLDETVSTMIDSMEELQIFEGGRGKALEN